MTMPEITPVTTQGAKHEPSPPPQPDPLDVALEAVAVALDTSTTTKQRTEARDAVRAIRAKRTPERTLESAEAPGRNRMVNDADTPDTVATDGAGR